MYTPIRSGGLHVLTDLHNHLVITYIVSAGAGEAGAGSLEEADKFPSLFSFLLISAITLKSRTPVTFPYWTLLRINEVGSGAQM